jgi:hypothetical protein
LTRLSRLEADGLANLNGSREALNDFITELYFQDAYDVEEGPTGDLQVSSPEHSCALKQNALTSAPAAPFSAELHFVALKQEVGPARKSTRLV